MNMLPIFPLNLVVFPHENLNLHIFEPRYKQLINESLETGMTFGMPAVLNGKLMSFGTEVEIKELSKRYEDGRLDIKTKGRKIFKIVDIKKPFEGKLYASAQVEFLDNEINSDFLNPKLFELVSQFYQLLKIDKDFSPQFPIPFSYQIAHTIGISLKKEFELLLIETEAKRQERLLSHLEKIIETMIELERTKERISMNGHFKEFDPLNF